MSVIVVDPILGDEDSEVEVGECMIDDVGVEDEVNGEDLGDVDDNVYEDEADGEDVSHIDDEDGEGHGTSDPIWRCEEPHGQRQLSSVFLKFLKI